MQRFCERMHFLWEHKVYIFFSVTMIFSAGVSNPRRADINVGLHIFMLPFQFFPFYGTFIWRMCFYNHFKFYSFILPSNLIKKDQWLNSQPEYCIVSYVNISRVHFEADGFRHYSANQYLCMVCNGYYTLGFIHNYIYLTEQSIYLYIFYFT